MNRFISENNLHTACTVKDVYVGGVLFGLEIVDMKGKFTIYAYIAKARKSINGGFPDIIS